MIRISLERKHKPLVLEFTKPKVAVLTPMQIYSAVAAIDITSRDLFKEWNCCWGLFVHVCHRLKLKEMPKIVET